MAWIASTNMEECRERPIDASARVSEIDPQLTSDRKGEMKMARTIEHPVTELTNSLGSEDTEVSKHPAFAQILACRVSGRAALYASDFEHNAFMTISICRSELHRGLNRDWHFARDEIIEVALTEAQWATFVSAPNSGSGVPCTIQHLHGKSVPGLPAPESRTKQFAKEIREDLVGCIESIDAAMAAVESLGLSKAKASTVKAHLEKTRRELAANLPYVAKQFDEHMEETVEKAKQEVHGYMSNIIQRAGLAAIADQMPLQIEHKGE